MKGAKTGGRKAGTPNRTTEEIRLSLLRLLDDNLDVLQGDLIRMMPKDRATLLISLAKHCTPPAINPEKLSTEQLEQILNYIKENGKQ